MNQRPTGPELKHWREKNRLSQEELGELLGVSREWIGKIERSEREMSAEIFLKFEAAKRESRFSQVETSGGSDGRTQEAKSGYGTPESIRKEILGTVQETIRMAGDDIGKLGWIREQVLRYASTPEHWDIHDKVLGEVLEEEKRKERERLSQSSPSAREA